MTIVHQELRDVLIKAVTGEMLGPGSENQGVIDEYEIISEKPLQRYSVGILYPQKIKPEAEDEKDIESGEDKTDDELGDNDKFRAIEEDEEFDNEDLEDESETPTFKPENDDLGDTAINTSNQYFPSSIGTSFYVSGINPSIKVTVRAARYKKVDSSNCFVKVQNLPSDIIPSKEVEEYLIITENGIRLRKGIDRETRDLIINSFDNTDLKKAIHKLYRYYVGGWIRVPLEEPATIVIIPYESVTSVTLGRQFIDEGLCVEYIRRPKPSKNCTLFTISLINKYEEPQGSKDKYSFFQTGLSIECNDSTTKFLDYQSDEEITVDSEQLSMKLLYRKRKSYAVGHGCAVNWESEAGKIKMISTNSIPFCEVPQYKFEVIELVHLKDICDMKNLSTLSLFTKEKIISKLREFVHAYYLWINKEKKKIVSLKDPILEERAGVHINNCFDAIDRMNSGIDELAENDTAFKAFQLANTSMLMQRIHTELQKKKRYPDDNTVIWPNYEDTTDAFWRPFQLAFLLLNIRGIVRKDSIERNIVDLIWFPTGGGKTEAYLGLSAFCIFLRRLLNPNISGTAIIMRYTLRLLTSQQFQRASTLICACDLIRKDNVKDLGKNPITIGQWIGYSSSPNALDMAFSSLDKLVAGTEQKNPFQVLSCPWCGTKIIVEDGRGIWGYSRGSNPKRFIIHCTDENCPFSDELPIKIIDEDIYKNPTTLLFGTVDKFAMIPWKKETSRIFAIDNNNDNPSPELIIQDELHLISGPLGTIVGLYETAIDALCSWKGVKPKIVASTATIRRATDQVKALFGRTVKQFPPQAIDIEDSFYAREASLDEKPGRMYIGLLSSGKTQTTMQVRLMSALLQYITETEYADEIKDKFWTLVGYFNTIRELGKCSTLVEDDIKDQVRRIAWRRNGKPRIFYEAEELNSRKKFHEIPEILQRLEVSYPNQQVINILLASNMISVGVDIDRLGLMTVVSQPKTTSEYIQATSRVGRMYPGIIFTLYDGARPRDRSHYERFASYHQNLYKYVEPTSVTPFSGPARDRALHAVFLSMIRHLAGLSKDSEAKNFRKDLPQIDEVMEWIRQRVNYVMDEEETNTILDLTKIASEWSFLAGSKKDLHYTLTKKPHLMYPAGKVSKDGYWSTLQTMRNVDVECNVTIID